MNAPNRIEAWILDDGDKPLTITEDTKIPNAATFLLRKQDHTLGNMIRAQLLTDPSVLFAGYQVPHPLENDITLKIQTDSTSNPAAALKKACTHLIAQTVNLKKQFEDQCRNIELGMGPEHAVAATAAGQGAGMGTYDPYGAEGMAQGRADEVGAYDF